MPRSEDVDQLAREIDSQLSALSSRTAGHKGRSMMTRRQWLASLAAPRPLPVPRSILVHEHILVNFIGADRIAPGRYDPDEVFRAARPKLEELKRYGCRRLLECTPNFLGRDPRLLARLSEATGLELWTNTGLYGAANHKYLPEFARSETAEQLARRWIEEARRGVDGIKPRFVKIGVNRAPLAELDRKLAQAAALTARETGLTVASHTGDGQGAMEQIEIFEAAKAAPALCTHFLPTLESAWLRPLMVDNPTRAFRAR